MRLITDVFAYCTSEVPEWNTISISGYHIREAGSDASQEVAFTLANGIEYVKAAVSAGMNVDEFAGRLSFFFNAHNDLLEEVAKFRAARRVWARIMKERFQAREPKSMMLRFHAQTGGSTLTAQQPDNNIVRVAVQALAAVLGGAQSLHTNSRDEALALPSEDAVRLALRTQQVLAYESGVTGTVDPLAGSYYVEALTDRIELETWQYIDRIEALGGMIPAILKGYVQRQIQEAAYKTQRDIDSGERVVVGLNKYRSQESRPGNLLRMDPELRRVQMEKLAGVKARRDAGRVREALEGLRRSAQGEENLMPLILAAVRRYATLGEICQVLREVFGEHRETIVL
jgi:methylmalonyl-CoA mutase N-terminal domain/subunit